MLPLKIGIKQENYTVPFWKKNKHGTKENDGFW